MDQMTIKRPLYLLLAASLATSSAIQTAHACTRVMDAPVLVLNPDDIELSGDVSGKFTKTKAPF